MFFTSAEAMSGSLSKNPYYLSSMASTKIIIGLDYFLKVYLQFTDGSNTSKVKKLRLKLNNIDLDGFHVNHDSYKVGFFHKISQICSHKCLFVF